jgi:hypothetical protein
MDGHLGLGHALALALLHERWAAAERERQAREGMTHATPALVRAMAALGRWWGRRARGARKEWRHDLTSPLAMHGLALPR